MGRLTAIHGASWHEIARARPRDIRMRLPFAVMIAVAGLFGTGGAAWPIAWLAAAVATQALALLITEPMRRDPDFQVSVRRERAFFMGVGLSAVTFAASGALFWFSGGWGGRLFAFMVLASGAVNVALKPGATPQLLWVGCAPFMVLLQVLPLISLAYAPPAERSVLGMTAFAGALFVIHLAAAVRFNLASARNLERALQDARRERLRADAACTEKDEFLGLMSHELRTPLNGVIGMAQAMQVEPLTPEQRDRLEIIRNSGEILRVLLNDVLEPADVGDVRVEQVEPTAAPAWETQRLRVLAAEDNPTNQLVLKTLLGQAGIEVHLVDDGEAAVEAWRSAHWDVLLMDIRMPRMDGLAATRAIRAAEAAAGRARTPIIAVSAETSARRNADYLAAGMDSFVAKPIQFAQLAAAIVAAIDGDDAGSGLGAAHG